MTFYLNGGYCGNWASEKTVYDPCPAGWRVPDGDTKGVWGKALGIKGSVDVVYFYIDGYSRGLNLAGVFGTDASWYPTSGFLSPYSGALSEVGTLGYCWSVTVYSDGLAYLFLVDCHSNLTLRYHGYSDSCGYPVRCCKE